MSKHDDFYWRMKPGKHHLDTRALSLEARGAYVDYKNAMYEGDGTLPDERTPKGRHWHMTWIGLRDQRTLRRLVDELLQHGKLQRLTDGRLTNADVLHDLAKRGRTAKVQQQAAAATEEPPLLKMMTAGSPPPPVGEPVDDQGIAPEMPVRRSRDTGLMTISGRKAEQNQRPVSSCIAEHIHEVVVVMTRFRARARAVIAGAWARAGPLPAPA